MTAFSISAIVTTHNEGEELHRTVQSIIENTRHLKEVIVVDDASTDGSCRAINWDPVRIIRHEQRVGVAYSRDEASRAARGTALCYLDAHQRVSLGCLDQCAIVALEQQAITCPDLRNFGLLSWRLYGADFRLCPKRGYFAGRWRQLRWRRGITPVTGLRAPPYVIPHALYSGVAWSQCLRGWGASEACVAVKAFFTGAKILQIGGPVARHRFRRRFHYETTWDGVWKNQAVIARICFDDATWFRYWLPHVFQGHLTEDTLATLESPEILREHDEFLGRKVRTDRQFWTELLRSPPPPVA